MFFPFPTTLLIYVLYQSARQEIDQQRVQRKEAAIAFVDRQLRRLIRLIEREGTRTASGIYVVSFGQLFKATVNELPTLAATLKTAQRRGIVYFKGPPDDTLRQGMHDDVEISLLRCSFDDSTADSVYRAQHREVDSLEDQEKKDITSEPPQPCAFCGNMVYAMDRVAPNDQVMHRACFCCNVCGGHLTTDKYVRLSYLWLFVPFVCLFLKLCSFLGLFGWTILLPPTLYAGTAALII